MIAARKVNNTTLEVQFSDGVQSEVIASVDTINEPANFSWSCAGRIQGWADAGIEVVTGGAGTPSVTVTLGFVEIDPDNSLGFTEWDSLR